MKDLEESIYQAQQVVDITPQDHPNLEMYLNNLDTGFRANLRGWKE
jgi:hypothetical protein